MKELFQNVVRWGHEVNLIEDSDIKSQFLKLSAEFAEFIDAIMNDLPEDEVKKEAGDCFVVSIMMSQIANLATFEERMIDAFEDPLDLPAPEFAAMMSGCVFFQGKLADDIAKGRDCEESLMNFVIGVGTIMRSVDISLTECLQLAHDKIVTRKGVMFEGTFIRSGDAAYPEIVEKIRKSKIKAVK